MDNPHVRIEHAFAIIREAHDEDFERMCWYAGQLELVMRAGLAECERLRAEREYFRAHDIRATAAEIGRDASELRDCCAVSDLVDRANDELLTRIERMTAVVEAANALVAAERVATKSAEPSDWNIVSERFAELQRALKKEGC